MGKLIDLTGRKAGNWLVLRREKTDKSKYHYWRCKCKCGFEKCFTSTHIQGTLKGGCGCDISLVGKKIGMMTALERIAKTGYTNSKYLWKCDCGQTRVLRAALLIQGKQKSCGCAILRSSTDTGVRIAFTTYKRNARKRGLQFLLTKDEFKSLILSKCSYCLGDYTSSTKENYRTKKEIRVLSHNGIDRIENHKGYTVENSVSCCRICNLMKRELSVEEWKEHMKKVLSVIDNTQGPQAPKQSVGG